MIKKIFKAALCSIAAFSVVIQPICVHAAVLYEDKEIQTITSGVTYEKNSRLYDGGWMDINVLTIDLQNPNVKLDVLESATGFGLKKTVKTLTEENNAVAAVNGDFFSSGNPRSSMGEVIKDGNVKSTTNYYNGSENRYPGLFIDKSGVAFTDYLKSVIGFYNSDTPVIELQAKNKVTDFSKPVYFDRQAITSTAELDANFSKLYKICVSNGEISDISGAGETVEVPEDGYIIVMNSSTALKKLSEFSVGQKVSFTESESFLFRPEKSITELSAGISGGGEILRNGEIISQGLIIGEKARNPRTALGVNQDKTKVIIMTVDGRGTSIGATHTELGNLLKEYGAYDAIHLDGGGSTTLALRKEGETDISILNTPSEGSQRYVANAFGVKSVGESNGEPASLNVFCSTGSDVLFNGSGSDFEVQAFDSNHNPIEINQDEVSYSSDGIDGIWDKNRFIPSSEGTTTIVARIGNAVGSKDFRVVSGAEFFNVSALKNVLQVGESTYLVGNLTNKNNFKSEVDFREINWSVNNPDVGYIDGGKFYATGNGTAVLTAEHNSLTATTSIVVGKVNKTIESFESAKDIYMSYYPEDKNISGSAGITPAYSSDGSKSFMLSYMFEGNSTQTQAAYACFERAPINIEGSPTNIGMWVKGDKSGNLLKAVIKDSNNREYLVSFVESLDSDQWIYAEAEVPSEAAYPIRIDKLYVAALNTTEPQNSKIFIDNISALLPASELPQTSVQYKDYKNIDINNAPAEGEEDITIFGQTASKPNDDISESMLQRVISKMSQNVRSMIFVGSTNINNTTSTPALWWKNEYFTTNTNNISIINLATKNGSIRKTNANQWRWLPSYLENFSKNNIIINMDKNIWDTKNDLSDSRENKLLHKILSEFVLKSGKNVLVVSASGTSYSSRVEDGVRYINLNGLSTYSPENTSSYAYLKVRATADDIFYCFEGIN